ncbi:MAG: energy transducer TonB, partial [Myxococcota bacterium]
MATPPQGQQQPRGTKPGAMTMAMQAVAVKPTGPKVLRIGLIQDGKIVEERIVRRRETVSVGTSEKNHFIVQAEGLPARFDLFQLVGNDYILNFTPAMRGRVGLPGGVKQLEQLRESGARSAGGYHQVKLSDTSRGKIVFGNTTLLFQFVVPPPVTPRPQLPAAARGGFVKSIDWLFTAFVVFSYMTFFGFIIYLENRDWEIDQGIARLPDSVTRLIFQEPEPPPPDEPVEETPTEDGEEEVPEEEEAPTRQAQPETSGDTGGESQSNPNNSAEARARIAEEVAASAEAMILGALGDS